MSSQTHHCLSGASYQVSTISGYTVSGIFHLPRISHVWKWLSLKVAFLQGPLLSAVCLQQDGEQAASLHSATPGLLSCLTYVILALPVTQSHDPPRDKSYPLQGSARGWSTYMGPGRTRRGGSELPDTSSVRERGQKKTLKQHFVLNSALITAQQCPCFHQGPFYCCVHRSLSRSCQEPFINFKLLFAEKHSLKIKQKLAET